MKQSVVRGWAALSLGTVALSLATSAAGQITFLANGIAAENAGAHANISATGGPLYNNSGATFDGITPVTFGNSFSIAPSTNGSYDSAFIIGGVTGGDAIPAGTMIDISFDFSLAKTGAGNVTWKLRFADEINAPAMNIASSTVIATGLLNSASNTFVGSGTYTFANGVSAGTDFRTFFEVIYTGSIGDNITGTMTDSGFEGSGVTIGASAIPEPSTYAALVALAGLGVAAGRRRRVRARP